MEGGDTQEGEREGGVITCWLEELKERVATWTSLDSWATWATLDTLGEEAEGEEEGRPFYELFGDSADTFSPDMYTRQGRVMARRKTWVYHTSQPHFAHFINMSNFGPCRFGRSSQGSPPGAARPRSASTRWRAGGWGRGAGVMGVGKVMRMMRVWRVRKMVRVWGVRGVWGARGVWRVRGVWCAWRAWPSYTTVTGWPWWPGELSG